MKAPSIPDNEPARLVALYDTGLLDSRQESRFDRLTQLVQQCLAVEVVLISLVDKERQWFKSRQGLAVCETARSISFCGHTILQSDILEVPDAHKDSRFADNPLVTGSPKIRFYAGAPLAVSGLRIGTLCLISSEPRQLSAKERHILRQFADAVEQEIHDRLQERALRESRDQFKALVTNIPGISYRCKADANWTMLYMSSSIDPLSGYPASDFLQNSARSYASVIHPDDRDRLEQVVTASIAANSSWLLHYRVMHRDGYARWVEERGQVEYNEDGTVLYLNGFIMDITERMRLQQLKDEFVATVSHELRTPLTAVNGALKLLSATELQGLTGQGKTLLAIAGSNGIRLQRLIDDLLDIEKLVAGKMEFELEAQYIGPILDRCWNDHRVYAEQRQVSLQLLIAAEVQQVRVEIDEHRLLQVLANLLSNAFKFSPDGGTVVLSASCQNDAWLEIMVQDEGPGIPEHFKERIFQRFSQADASSSKAKGGTGLGLALCKELVEAMHGDIGFYSEPGQGSHFFVRFPLRSV
ncbi:ATP-binding protein [Alkalimonas sp. NCh-2]|uniref:GAF domain-containing sensor histidine kinase n=1 Tax=Alkalimonas sp. NCh-2 TaxID=3144846 RepID=UPI0031F6224E